jgi:hypothetical protein
MFNIHKFLIVILCACCVGTVSYADEQTDNELKQFYDVIKQAGWGEDTSNEKRSDIFKQIEQLLAQDAQTVHDLKENAQAMKDKEQSTENKLLGGMTMAATGIGGQQLASGLAEKQADEEAEAAMRAYLATFTCKYGDGQSVAGGTKNVEIPGGNELMALVTEYKQLAADLKVRKQSLGLQPGIESEEILDSATANLYDDVAVGASAGAFTSLSRALTDTTGKDAAAWNAQKEKSQQDIKTGATVAGIGALAGVVGNMAINKDAPQESSEKILARRADIKQSAQDLMNQAMDECNKNITQAKDLVVQIKQKSGWQTDETLKGFVEVAEDAELLENIDDIIKIKDMPLCR